MNEQEFRIAVRQRRRFRIQGYEATVTGLGMARFSPALRFFGWSQDKSLARAKAWCDKRAKSEVVVESIAYDPTATSGKS